jgi:excisionase family DNA binding protein
MDRNTDHKLDLMTVDEVAALCRVQKKTVYNWNHLGDGPPRFRPSGGKVLFDRSDVEDWLRASRQTGREQSTW